MKRLVVLISGSGSNLQAIIDACQQKRLQADVVAVFSNRMDAPGVQRAAAASIPVHTLASADYPDRAAFDLALTDQIDDYAPDLVILAGYLRILSPPFVRHYAGRLLNIHPSLLPRYPGLHTHRQVLENQDEEHGASVHFVTEQLDSGPVILQSRITVSPQDTESSLAERVLITEHQIFLQAIGWFLAGRLRLTGNQAMFDSEPLPASGYSL